MSNCLNRFSTTEIQILENGLRWIKEKQDRFTNKFYNRLMREHPGINPLLRSIGASSFNRDCVQSLDRIIREIRCHGSVISPLKKIWPELSNTIMVFIDPGELINIGEIFLDLVSELAEDAWSPALECAWRKAIKTVLVSMRKPMENSLLVIDTTPFLFTRGKVRSMTQHMIFCLGTMVLMTVSMAALGVWKRRHIAKARLTTRKPLHLSICSYLLKTKREIQRIQSSASSSHLCTDPRARTIIHQ